MSIRWRPCVTDDCVAQVPIAAPSDCEWTPEAILVAGIAPHEYLTNGNLHKLHVEANSHFVFSPDACFPGRLDSKVSLFHGGIADIVAVLQHHSAA